MSVQSSLVEVAAAVVRFNDTAKFTVAGEMETRVRGKKQQLASFLSPLDLVPADDRLHYGVEAAFGGVQVTGDRSVSDFLL